MGLLVELLKGVFSVSLSCNHQLIAIHHFVKCAATADAGRFRKHEQGLKYTIDRRRRYSLGILDLLITYLRLRPPI
jgi:hypothetical protein